MSWLYTWPFNPWKEDIFSQDSILDPLKLFLSCSRQISVLLLFSDVCYLVYFSPVGWFLLWCLFLIQGRVPKADMTCHSQRSNERWRWLSLSHLFQGIRATMLTKLLLSCHCCCGSFDWALIVPWLLPISKLNLRILQIPPLLLMPSKVCFHCWDSRWYTVIKHFLSCLKPSKYCLWDSVSVT